MDDQDKMLDISSAAEVLSDSEDSDSTEVTTTQEVNTDSSQALILTNLESLIRGHLSSMNKINTEAKKHKEMVDSVLANDSTFREHTERAKEANQIKSATRAQIMKQPSVVSVANKVKALKAEVNELQAELSEYLQEYQRMTGATEIEDEAGELMTIVNYPKLIKKSSKR